MFQLLFFYYNIPEKDPKTGLQKSLDSNVGET